MPSSAPSPRFAGASSPPDVPRRGLAGWLAGAALVAAVALVYLNCLHAPFIFDDFPAIVRNESLRGGLSWDMLRPPPEAAGATARPVVNATLALNYNMGGLAVEGYHLVNMVLHALTTLTLWGVLRRSLQTRSLGAGLSAETVAFAVSALWAVHPLLTESVVCVVQRNEELVALFYLLMLYCLIRSATTANRWPRTVWTMTAVAACALGMGSKEVMVTAPLAALLYDRTFLAGNFRGALRTRRTLYAGLALTWGLLAWLVLNNAQRAGTVGFGLGVSSWDYLLTQCRALTIYLKLAVWPHPLVVDYGAPVAHHFNEVWWQGLTILALLGVTLWALVRRPAIGFVGACFFLLLAPSSSIVPLTTQTIAEHRMYLPLAAVVLLAVLCLRALPVRVAGAVCLGLGVVLANGTVHRNAVFQNEERLWTETLAIQPGNARLHATLGGYYLRHQRWTEAADAYRAALDLQPAYADAHSDLASALLHLNRPQEALVHYAAAHQLKPTDPDIAYNFANALAGVGRGTEAIELYRTALHSRPMFTAAQNNLGDALMQMGRLPEAIATFNAALKHDPAQPGPQNNLGLALLRSGRAQEALAHFAAAVQLRPDSASVHHNYALALAATGKITAAIAEEDAALKLAPDYAAAQAHRAQLLFKPIERR